MGRQRNVGDGRWLQIFDGVKPCGLKADASNYVPFTASLPLPGHKAEPHQKLATATASPISCISLPSQVFFLNLVKGNYNIEPYIEKYFPSTPYVVKNTNGVTDKKNGGLRILAALQKTTPCKKPPLQKTPPRKNSAGFNVHRPCPSTHRVMHHVIMPPASRHTHSFSHPRPLHL